MKKYQFLYSATLNETIPKFMLLFLMTIPPILKKKRKITSRLELFRIKKDLDKSRLWLGDRYKNVAV